jgi:hypothetical protein
MLKQAFFTIFITVILMAAANASLGASESAPTSPLTAPEGYKIRSLDPIHGQVLVPDGWHFSGHIDPVGFTWIISREDFSKGEYKTGMKIQLIHGMNKYKKLTAEEFVNNFVSGKKNSGVKIINDCGGEKFGSFQRQCLETEESLTINGEQGKYHISYSLFWNNEIDTSYTMVFGAPTEEWDRNAEYLKNIGKIKLPDFVEMYRSAKSHTNKDCLPGISNHSSKQLYDYIQATGNSADGLPG